MSLALLSTADFISIALRNPVNAQLLDRLRGLDIPQCYLTAGCLFQAVWNIHSGHSVEWGVNDYDVFYFDDSDLTEEAEDRVIVRALKATADLGVKIEVRNQARVHLWYERRFKAAYPQLRHAREGIDRYLVACTRVGIDVATGELYAPDGLDDLAAGVLRPNPLYPDARQFEGKARSYQERWPWLKIDSPHGQVP
ncbi:nucleotidyltransferase family protein [Ottowia thiooxydans]|uniref:nucleotidyltransferase family protein n=1 Tax=Ottowia thiooxydans TaxID=219182 RepID=UPI00048E96FD|nr:nucleotidyltransferase family protein [Ottowia thiooxydans]